MKRLTYMSAFSRPLSHQDVGAIGAESSHRNATDGITGVLLTLGTVFFQIIEGGDAAVDDLYDRVLLDDRHTDITCLGTETNVADRLFPEWSMNVLELDEIADDVVLPLKLLLGRMSETQTIIERFTQPAVSRIMAQGLNPLEIPLQKAVRLVLFTDMVAFTAISDRLPIEQVSELVATYLEACSSRIAAKGGEVTKFLGDGVMAYFSHDQVDDALQSCMDMQVELQRIRENAAPSSALRVLYSGFGLAMGPVVEGPIGSSIKMDYTVIGEPVNTASRLEALTRQLNAPVLMTGLVADAASDSWDVTLIGDYDVGRDELSTVHALNTGIDYPPNMRAAVASYLDFLALHH